MSKKDAIICRMVIAVGVTVLALLFAFAEFGVAAWFDIEYQGMSYIEYVRQIHQNTPVMVAAEIAGCVAIIVCYTEVVYQLLIKARAKIIERYFES